MTQSFFEIDTKGTCLFCLSPNCAPLNRNKSDLTTATALKMLFRYLQIDIMKLANISSREPLLVLDASTNLAASLCDGCFFLVDEFLELFQDFERIRLQLEGCTWKLHEFIGKGTKDEDHVREYRRRVHINSRDELHSRFVEKLRMKTSEKCSKKRCSVPQIRLRRDDINNLMNGSEQLRSKKIKIGDATDVERHPVKMEVEDLQPTPTADFTAETTYDSTVFPTSSISVRPANWRKYKMNYIGNKVQAHAARRYKCVYCLKFFSYTSSLSAHQLMVHPAKILSKSNRLPSDVSNEEVKGAVDRILDSEQLVWTADRKVTCPLCHELFGDGIRKLKIHVMRCHKDPVCQSIQTQRRKQVMTMTTPRLSEENCHQQITTTQQTSSAQLRKFAITCDICGKGFLHTRNWHSHKRNVHKVEDPFKCDLCSKTFFQNSNLQRHLKLIHSKNRADNSNRTCDYCGNVYPSKSGLQYHLHVKHAMQLYASRIPSHISKSVFESTVAAIVNKILVLPVPAGNRTNQRSPCAFCGKALLCASNSELRVHLVRYHLEKVIESAEKAIMITGEDASARNDNTTTSSFIPCKSEYPSVIPPIQFSEDDDDGREFELEVGEGDENSLTEEDPLGI